MQSVDWDWFYLPGLADVLREDTLWFRETQRKVMLAMLLRVKLVGLSPSGSL